MRIARRDVEFSIFDQHMNKMRSFFFSLAILLLFLGCTSKNASRSRKKAMVQHHLLAPGGDFSLRVPGEMQRFGADSVPWAGAMPQSKDNAVIVYFFEEGASVALASPQIRVEYLRKAMEGVGSAENLFAWLKGVFIGGDYQGELVSEGESVTTKAGKQVSILEIKTPTTDHPSGSGPKRTGKHMIWAYLDQGDFLIGFAGTALDQEAYKVLRKKFLALVASYEAK